MAQKRPWWPMKIAASPKRRARGLLKGGDPGEVMVLVPCRDIHTIGMRQNLDVAFVDAAGIVLESRRCLPPRSRMRNKGACLVVERFSNASPWYQEGDRVILSFARKEEKEIRPQVLMERNEK